MQKRRTKARTAKLFNSCRRRSLQRQTQRKVRMRRSQFQFGERFTESESETES